MKGRTTTAWKITAVLLASAALGWAQANSLSGSTESPAAAGPGSVNYIEGQVSLENQSLSRESVGSATLKPGQTLTTATGYAEILLTPGAFLRVGHDSELQLQSAGLAGARVSLTRGSAMLEVAQLIKGTNLTVLLNGANARVEKKGLYKFDAGAQAIQTLDGELEVARDGKTTELGKHDQVLLASDKPLKKRGFDDDVVKMEPLYVWSKARSEDEAQASREAAGYTDTYVATAPGWYWNPYFGRYGFWPLAGSVYSPFGWNFYAPGYFGYYGYYPLRPYYGRAWRGSTGHANWHHQPGNRPGGVAAQVPRQHAAPAPRVSTPRPAVPRMAAPSRMPAPHAGPARVAPR